MGREVFLIDTYALITPIWRQAPTLQGVAQVCDHNLVQHLAVHRLVIYRYERLDAPVKVTRHPVGRADKDFGPIRGQLFSIGEADDPAMLEKATDDTLNPDIFGKTRDAGTE